MVVLGDLWWLVVVDGGWLWLMVVGWVAGYGGSRTLVVFSSGWQVGGVCCAGSFGGDADGGDLCGEKQ